MMAMPMIAALLLSSVAATAGLPAAPAAAPPSMPVPGPVESAAALVAEGAALNERNLPDEAEPPLRRALALLRAAGGDDPALLATCVYNLSLTLRAKDRSADALPLAREAVALRSGVAGVPETELADAELQLALLLNQLERHQEAEAPARDALARRERLLGAGHRRTLNATEQLADSLSGQGRLDLAEPLYRALIAGRTAADDAAEIGNAAWSLAELLNRRDRTSEAEAYWRLAIDKAATLPADQRDQTVIAYRRLDLAAGLTKLRRHADADAEFALGFGQLDHGTTDDAFELRWYLRQHAFALGGLRKGDESIALYRRVIAAEEAKLGPDDPQIAFVLSDLGFMYYALGRPTEAEAPLRRALRIREAAPGVDRTDLIVSLQQLGTLLQQQGRRAEGLALTRRALTLTEAEAPGTPSTVAAIQALGLALRDADPGESAALMRRALPMQLALLRDGRATMSDAHQLWHHFMNYGAFGEAETIRRAMLSAAERNGYFGEIAEQSLMLGLTLRARERFDTALAFDRRALDVAQRGGAGEGPLAVRAIAGIAQDHEAQGLLADAASGYQRAIAAWSALVPESDTYRAALLYFHGRTLISLGRPDEAIPSLRLSRAIVMQAGGEYGSASFTLARALKETASPGEAQSFYLEAIETFSRNFPADYPGKIEAQAGYADYALVVLRDARLSLRLFREVAPHATRALGSSADGGRSPTSGRLRSLFKGHVSAAWALNKS